jgi:hypothetical protein
MNEDEMGELCSTLGKMRNAYNILESLELRDRVEDLLSM